nr:MAG TPA: UPF0297 protein [Microviridae sp.]
MAKKLLHIIGAFVVKFFSRENVSDLIDQLLDALYEKGDPINDV